MIDDVVLDDHRARRRARLEVLLRFKDLSWQDQYKTYEVIQGYFIHSGKGSEALEELRERAECVTAVVRAAEHLGMAEGEAPGVAEYEQARKRLGLELELGHDHPAVGGVARGGQGRARGESQPDRSPASPPARGH